MMGVRVQQAEQQLLEWPTAGAGVSHTGSLSSHYLKIHFLLSASLVMLRWGVGQWEVL